MNKNLNKKDLVEKVAMNAELSKKDADAAISNFLELIIDGIEEGDKISLSGFGIFEKKQRKERRAINPATKQEMIIPASNTVKFRASQAFKSKIK